MLAELYHRCTAINKHVSRAYSTSKTGWSTPACSLAPLHGSEDEGSDELALTSWKAEHDAGCLEPADFVVDTQSGPASSKAHLCLSLNPSAVSQEEPTPSPIKLLCSILIFFEMYK